MKIKEIDNTHRLDEGPIDWLRGKAGAVQGASVRNNVSKDLYNKWMQSVGMDPSIADDPAALQQFIIKSAPNVKNVPMPTDMSAGGVDEYITKVTGQNLAASMRDTPGAQDWTDRLEAQLAAQQQAAENPAPAPTAPAPTQVAQSQPAATTPTPAAAPAAPSYGNRTAGYGQQTITQVPPAKTSTTPATTTPAATTTPTTPATTTPAATTTPTTTTPTATTTPTTPAATTTPTTPATTTPAATTTPTTTTPTATTTPTTPAATTPAAKPEPITVGGQKVMPNDPAYAKIMKNAPVTTESIDLGAVLWRKMKSKRR